MTTYWAGFVTPFAALGGVAVVVGLVWLGSGLLAEAVWWTVKRFPLHDQHARDRAASVVAAGRRAYVLRIPHGVRVIVSLGGTRDDQLRTLAVITAGRASCDTTPETDHV